jgi:hypothetical protein
MAHPTSAGPRSECDECVAQARRRRASRPMSDGAGAVFSVAFVLAVIVIANWWMWTQ